MVGNSQKGRLPDARDVEEGCGWRGRRQGRRQCTAAAELRHDLASQTIVVGGMRGTARDVRTIVGMMVRVACALLVVVLVIVIVRIAGDDVRVVADAGQQPLHRAERRQHQRDDDVLRDP